MEENTKEISLSQLWSVVKKSFLKALIFVLVGVILTVTILVVVNVAGKKTYSASTINVLNNVDDTVLSRLQLNKATAVNKSLEEFKNGSKKDMANDVLKELSIVANTKKKIVDNKEVDVPVSFKVSLGDVDLSDGERNELVSYIAKNLLNAFVVDNLSSDIFTFDIEGQMKADEYFSIAKKLEDYSTNFLSKVNGEIDKNPSIKKFEGTIVKKSFEQNLTDISLYKDQFNALQQYIVLNNVQNKNKLRTTLQMAKNNADSLVNQYNEAVTTAQTALNNYQPKIVYIQGSSNQEEQEDSATYLELYRKLDEYNKLRVSAQNNANVYQKYLDMKVPGSDTEDLVGNTGTTDETPINYVRDNLKKYYNSIKSSMDEYSALVDEYNNISYKSTNSSIDISARTVAEKPISMTLVIVLAVLVALIVYIVVYLREYGVLKKQGFFNESSQKEVASN